VLYGTELENARTTASITDRTLRESCVVCRKTNFRSYVDIVLVLLQSLHLSVW